MFSSMLYKPKLRARTFRTLRTLICTCPLVVSAYSYGKTPGFPSRSPGKRVLLQRNACIDPLTVKSTRRTLRVRGRERTAAIEKRVTRRLLRFPTVARVVSVRFDEAVWGVACDRPQSAPERRDSVENRVCAHRRWLLATTRSIGRYRIAAGRTRTRNLAHWQNVHVVVLHSCRHPDVGAEVHFFF